MAAVGDEVGVADLRLDLRDHGRKRVAFPRVKADGRLQVLPGIALAWAMATPLERWSVVASETFTPNS